MKTKIILLTTLVLLSFNFTLQAQNNDLFNKLNNNKDITSVYISKSMISMLPNDLISTQNNSMQNVINKLEQVEVYTSDTKNSKDYIKKEVNSLVNNNTYELLMNMKDGNNMVTFYSIKNKDNKDKIKELLMLTTSDGNDCTLIRMIGDFTADDLKNIINSNK